MINKRIFIIFLATVSLLLIPLIAMQFTSEVDWSISDFLIMGALLFSAGILCEFVLRKVKRTKHRLLLCAAILFALLIIWAELAVGLFGTPFAGS